MLSNESQKIWTAISLLFPNGAQAKSIFFEFFKDQNLDLNLSELSHKDIKRLYVILLKTNAYQSSQLFGQFDFEGVSDWEQFYRRSHRIDLVLFVFIVILKKNLEQISFVSGLTIDEIRLKIKKALQKAFPLPGIKAQSAQNYKLKEYNADDKSAFFIREKLIENAFSDYLEASIDLADEKIKSFNEFVQYDMKLKNFKNSLSKAKFSLDYSGNEISMKSLGYKDQQKKGSKNKFYIAISIIILSFLVLLVVRPDFIKSTYLKTDQTNAIELQAVKISRTSIESSEVSSSTNSVSNDSAVVSTAAAVAQQFSVDHTIVAQQKLPQADKAVQEQLPLPQNPKDIKPDLNQKPVAQQETQVEDHDNKTKAADLKSSGVYRGTIYVNDIQAVSGLVKDRLIGLGGQKAGEVELGWMKSSTISYFHFLIPKENQDTFASYLKQFGQLKVKFENHPRVLPKGTVRYIIEIKVNE